MANKKDNINNMYLFSHGRTAFKYGLINLGMSSKNEILLPKYICDVVLHPIKQLGIGYRFYSIFDDLKPDWDDIEKKINNKTNSILMVHYFGQAQDITAFKEFCSSHNIFLIEDNAHGFGGELNGKLMGTLGDVGFSSPRKFLNTFCGGALWIKGQKIFNLDGIPQHPLSIKKIINNKLLDKNSWIKNILKDFFFDCPNYKDPRIFRENYINNYRIDYESKKIYETTNWQLIRSKRQEAYHKWQSFTKVKGLKSVYSSLQSGANPWCFPAYANNQSEANRWFRWGWNNNIKVFPWPVLPEEIILEEDTTIDRWRRLVCFSTDSLPPV